MSSEHNQHLEPAFVFQHGWGFSETCWQGWTKGLSSYLLGNRGYWGSPRPIDCDGTPPGFILISHSLGLHFLPPRLLSQAGLLVIISGFAHFHGLNAAHGRFSRKHLQRMLARIAVDPLGLIQDFHRDCNCPDWPIDAGAINTALLTQDLTLLDQSRIDTDRFQDVPAVLLLHGREDRIVRPERAEELAGFFRTSKVTLVDGAGHGLPLTHPQLCLHLIRDFYRKI